MKFGWIGFGTGQAKNTSSLDLPWERAENRTLRSVSYKDGFGLTSV